MNLIRIGLILLTAVQFGYSQATKYADDGDISAYRPRFKPIESSSSLETTVAPTNKKYTEPKLDVTKSLNQTLDSVFVKNKQIKYAQGYRVLVYAGTDKLLINQIKQKVYKQFPDIELYSIFKQPEYRISFGDFIDKIQANNYLTKILPVIPNALIVQEQINIRSKR
jgi:hypothetical protein